MIANYAKVYSHSKKTVSTRRINKEKLFHDLKEASFIDRPRLVRKAKKIAA